MKKNVKNSLLRIIISVILIFATIFLATGCKILDPLGVSKTGKSISGEADSVTDSGDFLSKKRVMKFFNNNPGEEINSLYIYLKSIINAVYVDELSLNMSKKEYETAAWHIAYNVLNEYASEDKEIDFKKKKGKFFVSEDIVLKYIQSSIAGITEEQSQGIAEAMYTYNTMVEYDSANKKYTMLTSNAAEFNAELVNINVVKGKIKLNRTKVDGAILTYRLTDFAEERHNLGKIKVTLVKNEDSTFGYSLARASYSKKGFGKPTVVIEATPSPTKSPKKAEQNIKQ